jgi:hypothetical protein
MQKEKALLIGKKNLGIALGTVFGVFTLLLGWIAASGFFVGIVEVLSTLYMGYEPSLLGALLGALSAFIHGFITGYLIAFVYNFSLGSNQLL